MKTTYKEKQRKLLQHLQMQWRAENDKKRPSWTTLARLKGQIGDILETYPEFREELKEENK